MLLGRIFVLIFFPLTHIKNGSLQWPKAAKHHWILRWPEWADVTKKKVITRISLLPLKMTVFPFSKQKRERIGHSLSFGFLFQENISEFLVSDCIAVWRQLGKVEICYYCGALHQMESKKSQEIVSIAIWSLNIFDGIFKSSACLTALGKNMSCSLLFLHFML